MNNDEIKIAVENGHIEWQKHALERMLQRGISRDIVKSVLLSGTIIEDYPDDMPYPTALFMGWFEQKPFHVVAAFDSQSEHCFVITVYCPDLEHFEQDYKTRRKNEGQSIT